MCGTGKEAAPRAQETRRGRGNRAGGGAGGAPVTQLEMSVVHNIIHRVIVDVGNLAAGPAIRQQECGSSEQRMAGSVAAVDHGVRTFVVSHASFFGL